MTGKQTPPNTAAPKETQAEPPELPPGALLIRPGLSEALAYYVEATSRLHGLCILSDDVHELSPRAKASYEQASMDQGTAALGLEQAVRAEVAVEAQQAVAESMEARTRVFVQTLITMVEMLQKSETLGKEVSMVQSLKLGGLFKLGKKDTSDDVAELTKHFGFDKLAEQLAKELAQGGVTHTSKPA